MYKKKDIIILTVIGIVFGFLVICQLRLTHEAKRIQTGEDNQILALEIAQLTRTNSDLRLEVKELSTTQEKYLKSLEDRKSASEELAKNLEKYQIIAGAKKMEGQGVEIRIEGAIGQEQLVDLVNALRNIGIEGMSINNKRFLISSYFQQTADGLYLEETKITSPILIAVTGNGPLIKESLLRHGGIIEQIKEGDKNIKITVEQKEKIILPSA
jgi:uncharacterized protein YlxW (UPF0749 family)